MLRNNSSLTLFNLFNQDDECYGMLTLVADGEMVVGDTECLQVLCQFGRKPEQRLAECVVIDFNVVQTHGVAQALPGCLGERFFGGETFCQKTARICLGRIFKLFRGGENARGECFTMTFDRRLDARHADNVGTDADDHAVSNAFILRTAASSPIKTASAMMAWPMLSSTMWGIATMGRTL